MTRARRQGLLVALAAFLADQLAKYAITGWLDLDRLGEPRVVTSFFNLTYLPNCGVSLGLLGDASDSAWVRVALTLVTSGIAAGVLAWLWRERARADTLALGLVFGGALGNIADRVIPAGVLGKVTRAPVGYPGCVIDFLDPHWGDWRPFLVFNVADVAITMGVLILLARALLVRDKPAPVESNNA